MKGIKGRGKERESLKHEEGIQAAYRIPVLKGGWGIRGDLSERNRYSQASLVKSIRGLRCVSKRGEKDHLGEGD